MKYTVHARRWEHGWELHIDGLGVTQCRRLSGAEAMVRDYIALDLGVAPDSFEVAILPPEVGEDLDAEVAEVKEKIRSAAAAQAEAAESSRRVVRKLRDRGLDGKETAAVLGVTHQRISQLQRTKESAV